MINYKTARNLFKGFSGKDASKIDGLREKLLLPILSNIIGNVANNDASIWSLKGFLKAAIEFGYNIPLHNNVMEELKAGNNRHKKIERLLFYYKEKFNV